MIISIITPVYKAESYLDRLISSVLSQTFPDFELILVDDGSPDKSGAICDKYAQRDSRIKVIHKENGGVSSARQAGLEAVKGEFIIHADSDDWLAPNMLEELICHQKKNGADVIIFDFYRVTNGVKTHTIQKPSSLDHKQVLKDIISGRLYASCWNKLIRHSTITKFEASFPKGINLGEDKCFLASLLKHPIKVSYLSKPLYNYDASINDNSIVRKITKESIKSGIAMVTYLETNLSDKFSDSIYEVKKRLKIRAIYSGLYSNCEIRQIFKSINIKIIINVITLKTHRKDDLMLFFHTIGLYSLSKLFITK